MTDRVACFTLDLEADYAGVPPEETYDSLSDTVAFEEMIGEHGIALTAFVTGQILDRGFPILSRLKALGTRFEAHTYSHPVSGPPEEKIADIGRGIDAHVRYFGARPRGYRAPQGRISEKEIAYLAREGFLYSSSVFPAWLPGRYNNLRLPTRPFRYGGAGLLEIPISVVPRVRLPITASHLNLLGWGAYRTLMAAFGCPAVLNVCMHLYDFADVPAYASLPLKERLGYARTRRMADKRRDVEGLLRHLRARGYRYAYLTDVAEALSASGG